MLSDSQIEEIRSFATRFLDPLFFFDDDPDGLASYLLFMRTFRKGHGICVRANPKDETIYHQKIAEYKPDVVFFFDKPLLSQELFDSLSIPSVWVDHHPPQPCANVHYFNPLSHEPKDNRPTTWWAYQATRGEQWVALVGCVADWFVPPPEFFADFPFPHLLNGKSDPEGLIFESQLGTLVRVFSFAVKGKTSEVNKNIRDLEVVKGPDDILNQTTDAGTRLWKHYQKINMEFQSLVNLALQTKPEDGMLIFTYPSTRDSLSSMLSNELQHRVKGKTIIVAREKNGEYRMSIRNTQVDILPAVKKSLEGVRGYGGGHPRACGAVIAQDDFPRFIESLKRCMAAHIQLLPSQPGE